MGVPEPYLHPPGRGAMFVVHRNGHPKVDETVYVAQTAVVSGDVTIGPHTRVLYRAVLTAEGGPIEIGANCIVMENAVLRGVPRHPLRLGDNVLVGPHAHLTGCLIDGNVRIATAAMLYNGAHLEIGAEVEFGAVVHVNTRVPAGVAVPMGWFAGGDPAELVPPNEWDRIRALMGSLDYPGTVFGVSPEPDESAMPDIAHRYTRALALHRYDVPFDPGRNITVPQHPDEQPAQA